MKNIDTEKMRKAVRDFSFWSSPSNGNSNSPCTVGDLKKVIANATKMMNVIIDEIESAE